MEAAPCTKRGRTQRERKERNAVYLLQTGGVILRIAAPVSRSDRVIIFGSTVSVLWTTVVPQMTSRSSWPATATAPWVAR